MVVLEDLLEVEAAAHMEVVDYMVAVEKIDYSFDYFELDFLLNLILDFHLHYSFDFLVNNILDSLQNHILDYYHYNILDSLLIHIPDHYHYNILDSLQNHILGYYHNYILDFLQNHNLDSLLNYNLHYFHFGLAMNNLLLDHHYMFDLPAFVEDKLLDHKLEDILLVVEEHTDYNHIVLALLEEGLSAFQHWLREQEQLLEL